MNPRDVWVQPGHPHTVQAEKILHCCRLLILLETHQAYKLEHRLQSQASHQRSLPLLLPRPVSSYAPHAQMLLSRNGVDYQVPCSPPNMVNLLLRRPLARSG